MGRIGDSSVVNLQSKFTTILDSSMVEHAAVNRGVVGSSPTRGVKRNPQTLMFAGFLVVKIFIISKKAYSTFIVAGSCRWRYFFLQVDF